MKTRYFLFISLFILVPLLYLGCSDDEEPEQFSLTVEVIPADGGTVNPSSGVFEEGEDLTLSAIPAEGYAFMQWGGDASGTTNPMALTITSDLEITAEFTQQDADGDGVCDTLDRCPDTPPGADVNANGCALSELDTDGDGITDDLDLCAESPANLPVDANGCADSQKDTDGDGVTDDLDLCPETPQGEEVDTSGCSLSQIDSDGDGVTDDSDRCPKTPTDAQIDEFGCPVGSEYTFVPDDAFEQILINLGYDDTLDDYVLTSSINTVDELFLYSLPHEIGNIADFTGIEGFKSLNRLGVNLMSLSDIVLDLSQNLELKNLSFACDDITDLEIISPNIEQISVYGISDLCPMWRSINGLDLSGVPNLRNLHLQGVRFADLNATLESAGSLAILWIESVQGENGPLELLDLSSSTNLVMITVWSTNMEGPKVINLRNGANQLLESLRLGVNPAYEWEVCVEADDPAYVESIIASAFGVPLPSYSVTLDCGN